MASPLPATNRGRHLLRLILSCRKITAQVTCEATDSIVAIASSSEAEFQNDYRARLQRFPRRNLFWDSRTSSAIGDKIGYRLREIGVSEIGIDVDEEMSRPMHFRKMLGPFYDAVKRRGIAVHGAEKAFLG